MEYWVDRVALSHESNREDKGDAVCLCMYHIQAGRGGFITIFPWNRQPSPAIKTQPKITSPIKCTVSYWIVLWLNHFIYYVLFTYIYSHIYYLSIELGIHKKKTDIAG